MSAFTFMYRGRENFASPEQMQQHLGKWVVWFKDLEAKGHIKDPGHPLEDGGRVIKGKNKMVHDGPFAEAKDVIAGYTVVEARDLDHAADLSKGCPILEVGGSVEVRPIMLMKM